MAAPQTLADLTAVMAPRIDALAARWCGADAGDGAQEVQRELIRAWPGFRGDAAPTTWAHRIAVRTLARFAERRRRQQRREPNESQLDLRLDEAAVAGFRTDPFTQLTEQERRDPGAGGDRLLYDVTSTYFEGKAANNPMAQRGHSRDHRSDCKQVCGGEMRLRCVVEPERETAVLLDRLGLRLPKRLRMPSLPAEM